MNILDMIEVIKEKRGPSWAHNDLYQDLTGLYEHLDYDESNSRITEAYYKKWLCTDTWVGGKVYFLDEEAVAISWQPARKSKEEIYWLSRELALKTKEYLATLVEEPDTFTVIGPDQLDVEFDPKGYSVSYGNSLLSKTLYRRSDDTPCTVHREAGFRNYYHLPVEEWSKVNVVWEDGTKERVDLKDFYIPWGE